MDVLHVAGPWAMGLAQIFSVLVQVTLWVGLAALSVRVRRERARRLLVAAGLIGAVLAVVMPALSTSVTFLVTSSLSYELIPTVYAALTMVGTMVWLVPWGLLLGGLWRAGGTLDEDEDEDL